MSRSEFRWNKKRKHYAYLHKDIGTKRINILISSKPIVKTKKGNKQNIKLIRHPNSNKEGVFYLIERNYLDDVKSFDNHIYIKWSFDKSDKRKVKRIKKNK